MELRDELSKNDKARPATSSTVYTRPQSTAASVIENRSRNHFISQISTKEALESLEREKRRGTEGQEEEHNELSFSPVQDAPSKKISIERFTPKSPKKISVERFTPTSPKKISGERRTPRRGAASPDRGEGREEGGAASPDSRRQFSKFWSEEVERGAPGRVWNVKREQRAESEIIARQRRWQDVEDESLIRKISKKQKKEALKHLK